MDRIAIVLDLKRICIQYSDPAAEKPPPGSMLSRLWSHGAFPKKSLIRPDNRLPLALVAFHKLWASCHVSPSKWLPSCRSTMKLWLMESVSFSLLSCFKLTWTRGAADEITFLFWAHRRRLSEPRTLILLSSQVDIFLVSFQNIYSSP